ncbi:CdaA regulatory protein CdaR [Thermoflexales bacterium]|nr:CdaA regulatory protein CdaR [Thermoflexales bacterium]
MKRVRGMLGNLGNLLLAIILAVLVWVVAERQANPSSDKTFSDPIPLTRQNLPAGMVAYDASAEAVRVTVSVPDNVWNELNPNQITAWIDLSGQLSGTLDLPVKVSVPNRAAPVVKIEPAFVRLKMEPLAETQLPVSVAVSGDPAPQFAARPLETIPTTVTARGPASFVRMIAAASGQLSIQDARATISRTIALIPRDRDGQTVPYVTLNPSSTLAVVQLQQLGGYRDLAVKIELRGTVAPGYLTTNVSVNPQIVTVFGGSSALEALPGFISTEPVSVTDATGDINSRVRLVLPPGVSFLGDPTVQVEVKIKAIESSVTTFAPLTPQGLSPDLSARFSPEILDVILSGPIASLNALQPSDIQAFANLFNLTEGTYQITPTVSVPSGINVVSILPSTVQVTIGPYVTPTLTTTATITSPLPSPTP